MLAKEYIETIQESFRKNAPVEGSLTIAAVYCFAGADELYANYAEDIRRVVEGINEVVVVPNKVSKEATKRGEKLYGPVDMNAAFKVAFRQVGKPRKLDCKYNTNYHLGSAKKAIAAASNSSSRAFREMDFVTPNRVGIEVQFGKYAFMVYNVCAKMTIFRKSGLIDFGIEIVAVKELQKSYVHRGRILRAVHLGSRPARSQQP